MTVIQELVFPPFICSSIFFLCGEAGTIFREKGKVQNHKSAVFQKSRQNKSGSDHEAAYLHIFFQHKFAKQFNVKTNSCLRQVWIICNHVRLNAHFPDPNTHLNT